MDKEIVFKALNIRKIQTVSSEYSKEDEYKYFCSIAESLTDNFMATKNLNLLYNELIKWCHTEGNKGYFIAGLPRKGKTTAINILASYLLLKEIKYSLDKVVFFKTFRCYNVCEHYVSTGEISSFLEPDFVCFDDLGTEPTESIYMGNRIGVMRQIIEAREDMKDKITFYTSNFQIDDPELMRRYGERAMKRIIERNNYFEFK